MAEQYTPTTEEMRERYQDWADEFSLAASPGADFDRWLVAHDAQVLRDAAMATRTDRFRIDEGISTAYANTFEAGVLRVKAMLLGEADRIAGGTSHA